MYRYLPLILIPLAVYTQQVKSPAEIQKELEEGEEQFDAAKEIFNPWYTGPLVAPSASMMPPGYANIQPYLYFYDNYAVFDNDRTSVGLTNNLYQFQIQLPIQIGVTETMDIALVPQGIVNWQDGQNGGGINDLAVKIGWPICLQQLYVPQIKFSIGETFPIGKYQKLSDNGLGLNATGSGAWKTSFTLTLSKLFFWTTAHPFNTRLALNYSISTPIKVKDFNAYGGGFKTYGTVHPGNAFYADLGLELSLTQRWVFATDILYQTSSKTTFNGNPGTRADGSAASVGGAFNDNLSIAPAIEYNWNANLGVLGGVWFSVYGKNSLNFVSGIISVSWTFPSD